MKNKEKYFDELIKESLYGDLCDFANKNKIVNCTFFGKDNCENCHNKISEWLEQEYQEPILDEQERKYLSAVIKPWRDKVVDIAKRPYDNYEYIVIRYYDYDFIQTIQMPLFEKDTMYKGMELDKEYTLEELGL